MSPRPRRSCRQATASAPTTRVAVVGSARSAYRAQPRRRRSRDAGRGERAKPRRVGRARPARPRSDRARGRRPRVRGTRDSRRRREARFLALGPRRGGETLWPPRNGFRPSSGRPAEIHRVESVSGLTVASMYDWSAARIGGAGDEAQPRLARRCGRSGRSGRSAPARAANARSASKRNEPLQRPHGFRVSPCAYPSTNGATTAARNASRSRERDVRQAELS